MKKVVSLLFLVFLAQLLGCSSYSDLRSDPRVKLSNTEGELVDIQKELSLLIDQYGNISSYDDENRVLEYRAVLLELHGDVDLNHNGCPEPNEETKLKMSVIENKIIQLEEAHEKWKSLDEKRLRLEQALIKH